MWRLTPALHDTSPPTPPPPTSATCVTTPPQVGPGKLEAYFYPPLDLPPYAVPLEKPVVTRLGVRSDVSKDTLLAAMHDFGVNDGLYALLNR